MVTLTLSCNVVEQTMEHFYNQQTPNKEDTTSDNATSPTASANINATSMREADDSPERTGRFP